MSADDNLILNVRAIAHAPAHVAQFERNQFSAHRIVWVLWTGLILSPVGQWWPKQKNGIIRGFLPEPKFNSSIAINCHRFLDVVGD